MALRAQTAIELGEPLPEFLAQVGPGNRNVVPESWGLTVEQWFKFLSSARSTATWKKAAGAKGYVNLYDLNAHFIKPWTRGSGSSVALRMNAAQPLEAQVMVSHTWAEDIEECAEALTRNDLRLHTPLWFCAYSVYQPGGEPGDVGPGVPEQLALDPFARVIARIHALASAPDGPPVSGMEVIHTSRAEVYDRLWCVYEIAVALRWKVPVKVACSDSYLEASQGRVLDVLKVDTKRAQCFSADDRKMINRRVRKSGGYKRLNQEIFQFRMQMLCDLAVKRGRLEAFKDEFEAAECALQVWQAKTWVRRGLRIAAAAAAFAALVTLIVALIVHAVSDEGNDSADSALFEFPTTTFSTTTTTTNFGASLQKSTSRPVPDPEPFPRPPPTAAPQGDSEDDGSPLGRPGVIALIVGSCAAASLLAATMVACVVKHQMPRRHGSRPECTGEFGMRCAITRRILQTRPSAAARALPAAATLPAAAAVADPGACAAGGSTKLSL